MSIPSYQKNAILYGMDTQRILEKNRYIPRLFEGYIPGFAPANSFFGIGNLSCFVCRSKEDCFAVAAAVAIIAAVVLFIYSAFSAMQGSKFKDRAKDAMIKHTSLGQPRLGVSEEALAERRNALPLDSYERQIYYYSNEALVAAAKERKGTSLAQFIMGAGIVLLATALIIAAKTNNYRFLIYNLSFYGSGTLGVGLLGYAIVQIHHRAVGQDTIIGAYNRITYAISKLEAYNLKQEVVVPQYNFQSLTIVQVTINYKSNTPNQDPPPPGYEESLAHPAPPPSTVPDAPPPAYNEEPVTPTRAGPPPASDFDPPPKNVKPALIPSAPPAPAIVN